MLVVLIISVTLLGFGFRYQYNHMKTHRKPHPVLSVVIPILSLIAGSSFSYTFLM